MDNKSGHNLHVSTILKSTNSKGICSGGIPSPLMMPCGALASDAVEVHSFRTTTTFQDSSPWNTGRQTCHCCSLSKSVKCHSFTLWNSILLGFNIFMPFHVTEKLSFSRRISVRIFIFFFFTTQNILIGSEVQLTSEAFY